MREKTWTMADDTRASNPGCVTISRWRWARQYPRWPIIWGSLLVASAVVTLTLSWYVLPVFFVLLYINFLYWIRVREHFVHGDANPGLVIAVNPPLVAVATDLRRGDGSYPVINISRLNWHGRQGCDVSLGSRLATVAVYRWSNNPQAPFWGGFDPRPLQPLVDDLADAQGVMDSFPEESWERLQNGLAMVPKPYVPGLYRLGWNPQAFR